MSEHSFPEGFVWGTATSSQQVEGAVVEDGRGESIWDRFAATPGKIADGSDPSIACDHYHRWREDVSLMHEMGVGAYRFSTAWPRILPAGRGRVNPAGLEFYDRLVDGLLDAGIEPFPTLYHWDLPQMLQDRGGWADRDTVEAFCEYTSHVTRRLGDRVKRWTTHNEPWCISVLGHEEGHHAPGHKDPAEALRVAHHVLLSHGKAVSVIRSEVSGAEVGLVNNHCPAYPASDSPGDHDAARWFDGFFNRWFLDPVFLGRYPEDAIADRVKAGHLAGPEMDFVRTGDMETIAAGIDFLGVNYYSRNVMRRGEDGKPVAVPQAPKEELTDMGWEVFPAGLYRTLTDIHREYAPKALYITENGAAWDYPVDSDGRIRDEKRIEYLRAHLAQVHRAMEAGVPVAGYFAWSLLDNFEWGLGYEKKFGLFGIDPATKDRIAKDSVQYYRDVVRSNAVDVDRDASPTANRGESRAL